MGRFSRYEFVQKIAIGGMAEVWSAWAVAADGGMTDVVVKRILPQFAADESFQNMLLEEAEVTARLQHANIVQVLDWGHLDDTCFLAMERVVGLDGRQLLDACAMRKIAIPPAVALHAMGEILKGLDYAHERTDERGQPLGIVHRDVSPSNVLLSVNGEVKLSDFGIARAKSRASHTVAGQVRGKPRYMSPEQAKGEELDGRSDLFAAGLVLHEFLTGQPVFPASTYLEEVVAIIEKGVPPPSRVNPALPPEIDALVLRLCERDVNKRFRTGAAAYEAIVEWASRRKMRLHGGVVAELVTSIVRPTSQKKSAEPKGETRIVRIDDADGMARFTTQGRILDPDLNTTPAGRAALDSDLNTTPASRVLPLAPRASPSGARLSAPVSRDVLDRPTDPPMSATNVMQMPTSSTAALPPEDDGMTDRRINLPENDGRTDRRLNPATRKSEVIGAVETGGSGITEKKPPRRGSSPAGVAGASVAAVTAIAIAIWWVYPRDLVQTGDPLDDSPVPTLALVDDPSITPVETATPEATAAEVVAASTAKATATRKPRASATPTAAAAIATAAPMKAGRGFLTLRARPNGEVTIDGQWAGSTPLSKYDLPSGVHTVTVNADDGRQTTEQFTITPDDTTTLSLTLKAP